MASNDTIEVTTPVCVQCGQSSTMNVSRDKLIRWHKGELAQNVFPELTPDERELLVTGTHPECWEKIFGKG